MRELKPVTEMETGIADLVPSGGDSCITPVARATSAARGGTEMHRTAGL